MNNSFNNSKDKEGNVETEIKASNIFSVLLGKFNSVLGIRG